jgi:anti-anti-sigma factor
LAATEESQGAVVLVVRGSISRAEIPRLCERARVLLDGSDADLVVCDVGGLVDSDVTALDALARLALTVRRLGRRVRLDRARRELRDLVALAGLDEVLPVHDGHEAAGLGAEPGGQAEQREEPGGVDEVVEPGDPTP